MSLKSIPIAIIADKAIEVWKYNKDVNARIRALEIANEADIKKFTKQYELCREIIYKVFEERRYVIEESFKRLDIAIEQGNNQLAVAALQNISNTIASNPLASFEVFSKSIESNSQNNPLELGF